MRCPYCAEEIQDAAILCRFCGARREGATWLPPTTTRAPATEPDRPGSMTLRTAGAFFLISAALEVVWITGEVPLLGALRGGAVAVAYHMTFAALYVVMGAGLVLLRPEGYAAVMGGTLFYTIDRALWLLDTKAQEAYFGQQLSDAGGLVQMEDLRQITQLTTLAILVSWWGFAGYVHYRRASLAAPPPPPPLAPPL